MKTFLLPQSPLDGQVVLTGDDYHYLCNVKRLKIGDILKVKDSSNYAWLAEVCKVEKDSCTLKCREDLGQEGNLSSNIHLFICLPKGKKMDLIVRQAGETGVHTIHPLTSRHSLVKIGSEKEKDQKKQRWQKVLREAVQQSGSKIITEIDDIKTFGSLIEYDNMDFFYLHQEQIGSETHVNRIRNVSPQRDIGLIVGPEGGLAEQELESLINWGFYPVYLGHNVLRVETAALYGIAMMQTLIGEDL